MDSDHSPIAVLCVDGVDAEVTAVRRVPLEALEPEFPGAPAPWPQIDRVRARRFGVWICEDARPDRTGLVWGRHVVTGDVLRVCRSSHPTPWNSRPVGLSG